jgi:hypothetical protein
MKRVLSLILAGVVLSGTVFVASAEAGGKKKQGRYYQSRYDDRYDRRYYDRGYYDRYDRRYFRPRDVVVIRDYYRPYYQPLPPGLQRRYYRGGYLPPGWARRVRPVPAYLEPEFVVVPRGYRRGLIDGNAVVYNNRGFILDLAVLF